MPIELPPAPLRRIPDPSWEHYELYQNVRSAIATLPAYFRTDTRIAGINITDLQTLNNALGATIEEQVVTTLNSMRLVWDPKEEYALYSFVRQAQTFPDVLLRRSSDQSILLGIELKGWYILAKEGEPSFRFQVTPAACSPLDMVVIVPWVLAQVISGAPVVFDPYIESALYAAEYRNYHWQYLRRSSSDTAVQSAAGVRPYPAKTDAISDRVTDQGNNFGRFARTGLMDDYLRQAKARMLCGLRVEHWLAFLKTFKEGRTDEEIRKRLENLRFELAGSQGDLQQAFLRVVSELETIKSLLQ